MTADDYCLALTRKMSKSGGTYLLRITITFAIHKTGTIHCKGTKTSPTQDHTFWILTFEEDPEIPESVKRQVNAWSDEFLRTHKPVEADVVAILKVDPGLDRITTVQSVGTPATTPTKGKVKRTCRAENDLFCLKILQLAILK